MPLYSHSCLSSFENCPRQFAFRYIEKPEIERKETIEAFLGSRIHETLEKLYQDVEMERTPKWDDILDDYERRWEREWSERVAIVRGEYTAEDYRNVGRRCLKEYFVRYFPFREGKVIGLEYRILVDLAEGRDNGYKLQGYIDRLVDLGNGEYEIHDYKTSRSVPEQDRLDGDRQLALYQIGVQAKYPDARKVHLIWHYVRQDKEVRSYRTPEQLDVLRAETIALIDTIEEKTRVNDFPPHETMLCDWCEYHDICPAKRHLVLTRGLSAQEFAADRGVALADEFVNAKAEVERAEVQLDRVRQMVLQFAQQQDVTTLRGHDRKLKISTSVRERLPSEQHHPDALARLETAVRASGKWEQVSKLAEKKLREALQTDLFDSATKQRINDLLIRTVEQQVRIARLSPREVDED